MPHPGARNRKVAKFTVNLADEVNVRLERLADASGSNKSTMAAMCIAAGVNMLERFFLMDLQQYVVQASEDKANQLAEDVKLAGQK